ncbi:uncharacterized protein [Arachis hypogaea]|uniref:uncharacterized protein isoform X3 n=1 Tax=Arachis hypogaea TaxID=3818 RepID=UPI000DEC4CF2|nr:uncharacterized protein LOC112710581 isoform X3 [Arachis hypogaea]XP_029144765.1 uncharacterized protein LOC112710581 isoform X3 [Arachis hypogaea]
MTFPKEHSIFRLHILFFRITSLRKRLALMKNFLGHKVSLERASQGHLSFEIPLILIISLQYVVQDHLEDFNWCCRGKCNPTTHSRGLVWVINILLAVKFKLIGVKIAPLGINKGMNTDTIVKAKSFLDGDEDQHEKDVFEKNLKALQKIF